MSVLFVPTVGGEKLARYVQRTSLDGREYVFRFRWNGRSGVWYADIYDFNDDPIVVGLALVQGKDLLFGVTDERRPPGELYLVNTTRGQDPGLDDLGNTCKLVYFDLSEQEQEAVKTVLPGGGE